MSRLEEIKKRDTRFIQGTKLEKDLNWLIKQAEEKIQLEERVKELEENLEHGAKVAVKTAEKLHYAREEIQRYKQALEEIARWDEMVYSAREMGKFARQALQGGNDNE